MDFEWPTCFLNRNGIGTHLGFSLTPTALLPLGRILDCDPVTIPAGIKTILGSLHFFNPITAHPHSTNSLPPTCTDMFSKIALFSVSVLVAIATANPLESRQTSQCNTGTLQCCNSVQSANSPQAIQAISLLGLILGPIIGQVGLGCSPINVVGLSQNSW